MEEKADERASPLSNGSSLPGLTRQSMNFVLRHDAAGIRGSSPHMTTLGR
jgi:hypothetical protein